MSASTASIIFEESSYQITSTHLTSQTNSIEISDIKIIYFVPQFEKYHVVIILTNGQKIELQISDIVEFLHTIKQLKSTVVIKNEAYKPKDDYSQYRIKNPWMMSYGINSGVCQL